MAELERDAWELFHEFLLPRSFPAGLARVRHHRRLGHRTLLITGALDFVVDPLRPLFDDVVCAQPGRSATASSPAAWPSCPPIGEARALLLERYADEHGLSLADSVAYADSSSDLAMLEAVGFPVAVNPDARLAAIARRRGWLVEHWPKAGGGAHRLLPLGAHRAPRSLDGERAEDRGEGAPLRAQPAPVRRVPARLGLRLGAGRGWRPLRLVDARAPAAARRGLAPRARRCSRASAVRTSPPSTAAAPATSSRS